MSWGQTLEGFQPFSTTIFLPWRDSWAKPVHHLYTTNRCQLSEWDITPVHSNAHPTAHYEAATGPPLLITCFREPLDSPGLVWEQKPAALPCAAVYPEFACTCSYDPVYWNAGLGRSGAHSFNFCKQTNSRTLEDHTVDPGPLQPSAATILELWRKTCPLFPCSDGFAQGSHLEISSVCYDRFDVVTTQ